MLQNSVTLSESWEVKRDQSKWRGVCRNPANNPKCRGTSWFGRLCRSCSLYGIEFSEEHKKNLSAALKGKMVGSANPFYGRVHSQESLAKIRNANKGRVFSAECRRRLSEMRKGRVMSDEHRRKINEANANPIHRAKLSLKMSGKNNPFY